MTTHYDADVIIIGAGHVGLTAALLMAQGGLKVILVDARMYTPRQHTKEYDCRVTAITPASVSIFQGLNIWEEICATRVAPFREIDVWQEHSDEHLHFNAKDIHQPQLGFIVENDVMLDALFAQIKNDENIIYNAPLTLRNYFIEDKSIRVDFAESRSLYARVLIGADGAHSHVRELSNIAFSEKDYSQSALVATIHTEKPHQHIARQRFLASGPLAFLPLAEENLCSIVWSHQDAIAKELAQMSEVEFNTALQDAFGSSLGEVRVVSERKVFPLYKRHVNHYIKPRIALIGDAAHSIHPLAGQGMNLGLQDAMTLAEDLIKANKEMRDIGLLHTLRRYERARKSANGLMLSIVDAFHYIFSQQKMPVRLCRDLGFYLTEHCKPLKKIIMRRAMGLT